MSLRPDEVSAIIQQELKKYTTDLEMESRGSVLQVGDGIARVWVDRLQGAGHGLDRSDVTTARIF